MVLLFVTRERNYKLFQKAKVIKKIRLQKIKKKTPDLRSYAKSKFCKFNIALHLTSGEIRKISTNSRCKSEISQAVNPGNGTTCIHFIKLSCCEPTFMGNTFSLEHLCRSARAIDPATEKGMHIP